MYIINKNFPRLRRMETGADYDPDDCCANSIKNIGDFAHTELLKSAISLRCQFDIIS